MEKQTIVVHSGLFHADDIFAVATLFIYLSKNKKTDISVIRTREKDLIEEADFVVDVGQVYDPSKKRFDHHQKEGAGLHENNIPYASFGLVWKEYGVEISESEVVAKEIENKLVLPIDAFDNGVSIYKELFKGVSDYSIYDFFYSFLLDEEEDEETLYRIFMNLVLISKDILEREIIIAKTKIEERKKVEEIYNKTEDKRIIILPKPYSWKRVISSHSEPFFVIYPRNKNTWNVQTVRNDPSNFEDRKKFPESWAGKEGEDLQKITGVSDAKFCHRDRFLVVANSKESAISLAKIALES